LISKGKTMPNEEWMKYWLDDHIVGDKDCKKCSHSPDKCEDCGGLTHYEWGNWYDEYDQVLEHCCDTCENNGGA